MARFQGFNGRYGSYRVSDDTLTRRNSVHQNPSQEGTDQVQRFRFEGDDIILTSPEDGNMSEIRFRRIRR